MKPSNSISTVQDWNGKKNGTVDSAAYFRVRDACVYRRSQNGYGRML